MTYPVESKSYVSPSALTSDGWRAHFIGEEEKIETAKLAKQDWVSFEGQGILCHCSLVLSAIHVVICRAEWDQQNIVRVEHSDY
jgi:hypothetical protein